MWRARAAALSALAALAVGAGACGGDESQRQDANEPSGDFPAAVTKAKFPAEQRLGQTSELQLAVENTGSDPIPNLVVTIWTDGERSGSSFSLPSDQPGLADSSRPVWILEENYPKLRTTDSDRAELQSAPSAGAGTAQTGTFAFGPLDAGDSKDIVWQVTAVEAGDYTVHYELAGGLNGKAKAVDDSGGPVKGDFDVGVTAKVPEASVADNGDVVIENQ